MKRQVLIIVAITLGGCINGVSPAFDAHRALFPDTVCIREDHSKGIDFAWAEFREKGACIHYDPSALRSVSRRYGYSSAVGVFAHEYGHILCMSQHLDETQECADAWAGCALAREGYEPFQYLRLINDVDIKHIETRHAATWRGWNRCNGRSTLGL